MATIFFACKQNAPHKYVEVIELISCREIIFQGLMPFNVPKEANIQSLLESSEYKVVVDPSLN